jgi:CubicO group peptidase (beta-lactamase class C family)
MLFLSSYGAVIEKDKTDKIDNLMNLCHEYRIFSGSVLVAKQGSIIYKNAFGMADRRWNIPNRVNTKYKIGSITKQFTALLIMQLVQENKIRLSGKVSDYLEYFPKKNGNKITVHHLLCHSSGIPNLARYYKDWFTERWLKEYSTREFIDLFSHIDLQFEPGSRWSYSNGGYYLLAAIIEEVTGKTYGQRIKEKIFEPLGMAESGYFDGYTIVPNMADGYDYWDFQYINAGYNNPSVHKGNGGLFSSVEDLLKWDCAIYTERLLSQKVIDQMFKPQMHMRSDVAYGYGWVLQEKFLLGQGISISIDEHFGSDNGFNNVITRIPSEQYVIILLSNTSQSNIQLIRRQIINILYDQPIDCPYPVSLAFNSCKYESEIKNVIENFRKDNNKYSISEDAVNGVGMKFIKAKRLAIGLEILEFNTSQFPQSPYVYDRLAEAYFEVGNKQKAIENYKRSLEINPDNQNALRKIKLLKKR